MKELEEFFKLHPDKDATTIFELFYIQKIKEAGQWIKDQFDCSYETIDSFFGEMGTDLSFEQTMERGSDDSFK